MNVKVFITVDTEEDSWDRWKKTDNPVENISRIPRLQELFDYYGAVPTYLVNYPVITNTRSSSVIQKICDEGNCEVGTHIHPWNTPPFEETICGKNSFICNIPQELAKRKLLNLHHAIQDRLGMNPTCFRAGRWGFGTTVASCIDELGYLIDTSITPFCDWVREEGPDFTDAPYLPYRFEPSDILSENSNGTLVEVPPTIGFFQQHFERCAQIRNWVKRSYLSRLHLLGILDRLRIINLRALSPEVNSGSQMIQLAKRCIKNGTSFLNLFFHSTSLLPGRTPFVKSEEELEAFLRRIELFLKFASAQCFKFAPLSDGTGDFNGNN
jgi:hypothetical protein